jgi:CPA2 family monovalent cation:H+ antiporter-2
MADAQLILKAIDPVILLLALGIVAAIISRELRLSPIVGYLVLGLALSRMSHQLLGDGNIVRTLSELGVVFLLFDIGLHFSFARMREQAKNIFGFAPLQVLFCALGLGAIALLFGIDAGPAFLIGTTLALSSTAVVARLIAERHQQNCPVGIAAHAILIFQDVAAIAVLIIATAIGSGDAVLPVVSFALVKAIVAFAIAAVLARVVVGPMLSLIVRTRHEEVFTAMALLIALATGWATAAAGLSMTLGAFLGGTMLADTPYRAVIQSEIKPFRGLLLGFFFVSVGLLLDGATILRDWHIIIGVAVLIVAVKIVLNMAASLVFRWSTPGSAQLGFLLAQGSEFAFVILCLPAVQLLIGQEASAVLIAAVALTLAATPMIADAGRFLAGRMRARARRTIELHPELVPLEVAAPVVIFGMGTRGRVLADALMEFGIAYLAVEADDRRLRDAIADGYDVMFGSAADPRLWQPIAVEGRKLNILTEPRFDVAQDLMPAIRHRHPDLPLIAAVADAAEGSRFGNIGLRSVVDGSDDGVDLAIEVLVELGVDRKTATNWARKRRQGVRESMGAVSA